MKALIIIGGIVLASVIGLGTQRIIEFIISRWNIPTTPPQPGERENEKV